MKQAVSVIVLSVFCFCYQVINVSANSNDNYGIGSKAASLGGALSASPDGPYAVFYNPAGLTHEKGRTISVGTLVMNPLIDVDDYKSNPGPAVDFEDKSPVCFSPHFGYSSSITDKISYGIAGYVPFGFSLEWDDDPNVNPGAYSGYKVWHHREVITPGIAYKINEKLSIGAAVSFGSSHTGNKLVSQGVSYAAGTKATFETEMDDDFNYSYNLGVMYKPVNYLSFGLTYRSRTEIDFKGETTLLIPGVMEKDYDIELKNVDHPEQIQAGVKYVYKDRLSIEADILWTRWSIVSDETVKFKHPDLQMISVLKGDRQIYQRDWNDVTHVKIGIEYKLNKMVSLRCGFYNDPSPVPSESFDFEWPDADKKTYSLGAGFNFENWEIDTAFIYGVSKERKIAPGESTNANASYPLYPPGVSTNAKGSVHGFGLTVSYKF